LFFTNGQGLLNFRQSKAKPNKFQNQSDKKSEKTSGTNLNSYVDDSIIKNSNENISSSKPNVSKTGRNNTANKDFGQTTYQQCNTSSNGKSSAGGCGTTTNIIVNNLFIMNPQGEEEIKY
jgi:predicted metal-dependent hydrolase